MLRRSEFVDIAPKLPKTLLCCENDKVKGNKDSSTLANATLGGMYVVISYLKKKILANRMATSAKPKSDLPTIRDIFKIRVCSGTNCGDL